LRRGWQGHRDSITSSARRSSIGGTPRPAKGTSRFRQEWMFGFRFFGLRRKLQHDRALAFAKMREQHDLSVGKFQRIMVRARLVHVHLPESGDR
jgi:hypothetical protein